MKKCKDCVFYAKKVTLPDGTTRKKQCKYWKNMPTHICNTDKNGRYFDCSDMRTGGIIGSILNKTCGRRGRFYTEEGYTMSVTDFII